MSLHYYIPDLHKLSRVVEILKYLGNVLAVYILRFVYEFDQSEQQFFFISLFSLFRTAMHDHIVNTLKLHFFNSLIYTLVVLVLLVSFGLRIQPWTTKRLDKTMSLQQNFSIIYSRFYNFNMLQYNKNDYSRTCACTHPIAEFICFRGNNIKC